MRLLKRILKIVMITLTLLFIGITVFFLTFDLNSYRGIITSKASQALGRSVTIESISMKISLIPTVVVKGITVSNPKNELFSDKNPLLKIDTMDVTLALIPLLSGQIELKDFNLATAHLTLVENEGQNNWTLGTNDTATGDVQKNAAISSTQQENVLERLRIDNISAKRVTLSYFKGKEKQEVSLTDVSIQQLRLLNMTVLYNGKFVKLSANLGDLAGLMGKRPNYTFSLNAETFSTTFEINGTIGDTKNFSGMLFNIAISGEDLNSFVGKVYKQIPQVPSLPFNVNLSIKGDLNGDLKLEPVKIVLGETNASLNTRVTLKDILGDVKIETNGTLDVSDKEILMPFGVKPLTLSYDMTTDLKNVTFNKISLNANKSDVALSGSTHFAEIPFVSMQVVSRYFELYDFIVDTSPIDGGTKSGSKSSSKEIFSSKTIDFSALKKVNASVGLMAQKVKIPSYDYVGIQTQATLNNGLLNVPTFQMTTPVGTVTGQATVDATHEPVGVKLSLKSDELKLDAIKTVSENLKGSEIYLDLDLNTKGTSVKNFASNLNGHVSLELTEGTIVNKWFNSLPIIQNVLKTKSNAISFSTTDQISDLVCGAMNLNIKNGVVSSDDQIALATSVINFMVSGDVNLAKEELSLTMEPSLSRSSDKMNNALALTQLVKISGPFTNLTPSLDGKKATQTAVKAGANMLANKIAEKQGLSVPTQRTLTGTDLCQKVLGRPLKGKIMFQTPKTTQKTVVEEKKEENLEPKEQFKRQLLNSLSEALKK